MIRARSPHAAVGFAFTLLLLLPVLTTARTDADPAEPPATAEATAEATMPDTPTTEEGRFGLAVRQSREAYAAELARLTELYRQAVAPADALAVQRTITALKQNAEIELMEIQLRFAREAGRQEQVAELEALIGQSRALMAATPLDAAR